MKIFAQILFIIYFFIGCKSQGLVVKCHVTVVENDLIESILTLHNHSTDTFLVSKELNFLPRDKDIISPNFELFYLNGRIKDTIASRDFHFSLIEDSFLFGKEQLSNVLLPNQSYSYVINISNYYPSFNKGTYSLNFYFKPHLESLQDTCVLGSFEIR